MAASFRLRGAMPAACVAVALFSSSALGASPAWDREAAKKHNDAQTKAWLAWPSAKRGGDARCISCHTAVPLALARPGLGEATDAEKDLIANVKARVAAWNAIVSSDGKKPNDPRPYYPGVQKRSSLGTEAVLNALLLVNHDARRNKGALSDVAKRALALMWAEQKAGAWEWLDFGLRPWEKEAGYYGAALAGVAVGMAGRAYYETDIPAEDKKKLDKLRKYLEAGYEKESLHNRLAALWASTSLPGVMSAERQKKLVEEALSAGGKEDEGWALAALGKKPDDKTAWLKAHAIPDGAKYDGYATGYVVFVLKRAKAPAGSGRLAKAIAWLVKEKVAEGKGPVHYPNRVRDPDSADENKALVGKFMRDAGAAYAALALADE